MIPFDLNKVYVGETKQDVLLKHMCKTNTSDNGQSQVGQYQNDKYFDTSVKKLSQPSA